MSLAERYKTDKVYQSGEPFHHATIDLGIKLKEVKSPFGRFYEVPGGGAYPSVTTVLGAKSKAGIVAWRKRVGEAEANRISRRAANRGTKLHTMCERYLLNQSFTTENKTSQALFEQVMPLLDRHVKNLYMIEQSVYSNKLTTAGRLDLYADWDGVPSIIDFKSSTRQKPEQYVQSYYAQGYAYSECIEELTSERPRQVVIVIGVEEDNEPQIFKKPSDDAEAAAYFAEAKVLLKQSISRQMRMKNG